MANHRKPAGLEQVPWVPGKGQVGKYGRKMREWWSALQPEARGGDWPLARAIPDDEGWTELKKGGPTGFVLMVIGLNWWVRYAESSKDQNEAASMVEDVVFALEKVVESMVGSADKVEPLKKKKRSVKALS